VLCSLLWVTLLGQGVGLGDPRGPCQPLPRWDPVIHNVNKEGCERLCPVCPSSCPGCVVLGHEVTTLLGAGGGKGAGEPRPGGEEAGGAAWQELGGERDPRAEGAGATEGDAPLVTPLIPQLAGSPQGSTQPGRQVLLAGRNHGPKALRRRNGSGRAGTAKGLFTQEPLGSQERPLLQHPPKLPSSKQNGRLGVPKGGAWRGTAAQGGGCHAIPATSPSCPCRPVQPCSTHGTGAFSPPGTLPQGKV